MAKLYRPRPENYSRRGGLLLLLALCSTVSSGAIVSAVLPGSRSVRVEQPATAFATVINGGVATAMACGPTPGIELDATFSYQTTDPQTNAVIGTGNTPVDISTGESQSFVFSITPHAEIDPIDVPIVFQCENTDTAPITGGLNTLLLSASVTPVPDLVALAAANAGTVEIGAATQLGAFAVASVNVGAEALITVSADTGEKTMPLSFLVCETDPATAVCTNPSVPTAEELSLTVTTQATPTFSVFVVATETVPFDPATKRVFVRFKDESGNTRGSTSVAVRTALASTRVNLGFGPYEGEQDPRLGASVSEEQIRRKLSAIVPYTGEIRTFGQDTNGNLHAIPRIADEYDICVAIGVWLDGNSTTNDLEVEQAISTAATGCVTAIVVGSETLHRGELTASQLIGYIESVRAAVPGIPVTTADTYGSWQANPDLVDAVDLVYANFYPFWEGVPLEASIEALAASHGALASISQGKEIVVSETGWPSCGEPVGDAVPSEENAAAYFREFVAWAKANEVSFYYFEAYDEPWKGLTDEGGRGACWGIFYERGALKPGMAAVFGS